MNAEEYPEELLFDPLPNPCGPNPCDVVEHNDELDSNGSGVS